jgi:L-iditol 2-dehydrogenase
VRFLGGPPVNGAMANFVVAEEDLVYPVPPSISDQGGALIEPLAVAVWACRMANLGPGSSVLVTGAGPIGLLSAQVAKASGTAEIVVSDINETRLQHAQRIGSIGMFDAREGTVGDSGLEVDALIERSGSSRALGDALLALRPAGTTVMVGMGEDEVTLPLDLIQRRELWLTGTFRYANVYPAANALAAAGKVNLESLITGSYELDEADAALRVGRDDEQSVKVLVMPGAGS